jgi:hypothetical protein
MKSLRRYQKFTPLGSHYRSTSNFKTASQRQIPKVEVQAQTTYVARAMTP